MRTSCKQAMRLTCVVVALFLAFMGTSAAQPATADDCVLEYRRADNMWGSWSDSIKSLGFERLQLVRGQGKAFSTDWRFEKARNDGTNYYGSHGRFYQNRGGRTLRLILKLDPFRTQTYHLEPSQYMYVNGDIVEVFCP